MIFLISLNIFMGNFIVHKFRLYPNKFQKEFFLKTLGCCRFVYNKLLYMSIDNHKNTGNFILGYDLQNIIPKLRNEFPFLQEVLAQTLQISAHNLNRAFKNKFKHGKGFPRFKSRKNPVETFHVPQGFKIEDKRIKLPKIGWVKYKKSREIDGIIKSLSITKDVDQWFVNILVEQEIDRHVIVEESIVGLDLGIKTFVTTSDGQSFNYSKNIKKTSNLIKNHQRRLSKKKKGSKNKEKQRIKLARAYRKQRRQKNDFLNKIVSTITKTYDVVVMENLNVKGMMKNRKLSRSIHESSFYSFKVKIKNKAKKFEEVDRFFPSSKTCSCCGFKKKELKLSERVFKCDNCSFEIDRDLNAAINIRNYTVGTTGIKACGDTSIGEESLDSSRYVLLKQEAKNRSILSSSNTTAYSGGHPNAIEFSAAS